jgi:tetratricopeptide (TPR) repeat protein
MKLLTVLLLALVSLLASVQEPKLSQAQVSIPGVMGVLVIDVGPTTWETHVRSDGVETQLQAMHRKDGVIITAFLQKVRFAASAEKCRAEWWPMTEKATPMKREDLHQSDKDGVAIVEYIVPEFRGAPVRQKTVHAYLGTRDLCAEVHLSKVQWVPDDQKLFDEVLTSLRLLPDQSPVDSGSQSRKTQFIAEASKFYLQHDYAAAAERYQKALDLEKQNRTLSKTFFRVLVDNLGMSYGITGKLPQSMEVFEYGITQDPEYPLFYYNLACAYGEMGKMDESLDQLRLAYKYKANIISGESFPDPLTDDSFRKFVKDRKFLDAVREMQRQ